jgi:c-di-AMP phosphodiesterase-like protein
MTSENIDYMTKSGMLFLDKQRKKYHFDAATTLKYTALIPIIISIVFLFKSGLSSWLTLLIFSVVGAGIFLLASALVFQSQQRKLKLTHFNTGLSKIENFYLAKRVIEILQWTTKENDQDFIEAYNPRRDFRTWGNEMISIVLLDNEILLNSICNLDRMNQVAFSFGKNKENIEKFINEFEALQIKSTATNKGIV